MLVMVRADDGIRFRSPSGRLGDVYKGQHRDVLPGQNVTVDVNADGELEVRK